jgi:hypothetical protein
MDSLLVYIQLNTGFKIWILLQNILAHRKKILKNKIDEVGTQTNEEHAVISNPKLIY